MRVRSRKLLYSYAALLFVLGFIFVYMVNKERLIVFTFLAGAFILLMVIYEEWTRYVLRKKDKGNKLTLETRNIKVSVSFLNDLF